VAIPKPFAEGNLTAGTLRCEGWIDPRIWV